MKVRAIWEFDVDTEGLDKKHVHVEELAKDITMREMAAMLKKQDLSEEDFTYEVVAEKDDRLKTILYNAISLLIDETFEQYDDSKEWLAMMLNNLDISKEELLAHGIKITVDGGLSVEESKKKKEREIKPFATKKKMDNFIASDCFGLSFDEEHQDICEGDKVIFVNRNINKILLPYVYVVERVINGRYSFRKNVHINMVKENDILNRFNDDID